MLRRLVWYMFTDVSEVLALCINMTVMKATSTSETTVYIYRLNSGTSQKAAIFIFYLLDRKCTSFNHFYTLIYITFYLPFLTSSLFLSFIVYFNFTPLTPSHSYVTPPEGFRVFQKIVMNSAYVFTLSGFDIRFGALKKTQNVRCETLPRDVQFFGAW
jgi:hypothetical protein